MLAVSRGGPMDTSDPFLMARPQPIPRYDQESGDGQRRQERPRPGANESTDEQRNQDGPAHLVGGREESNPSLQLHGLVL
jgi:hypothetical protein